MTEEKILTVLGSSVVFGLGLLWFVYRCFYHKKLGKRGVVKSLYLYPVKSCAGIKLDQVKIDKVGPLLDRTWVLMNTKGIYQNQISIPKLALVQPSFEDEGFLCLNAPGMPTLKLDIHMKDEDTRERVMLHLFSTSGEGIDCGDEAAEWFDKFLEKSGLRLYNGQNKDLIRRGLDPIWQDATKDGDSVIYSNFAPILLTSEDSLSALNKDLSNNPVDMRSFRPSIVIQGGCAFEEDAWNTVTIGDVTLRKFRNCSRCPLITVDPDSGVMKKNGEPLATLRRLLQHHSIIHCTVSVAGLEQVVIKIHDGNRLARSFELSTSFLFSACYVQKISAGFVANLLPHHFLVTALALVTRWYQHVPDLSKTGNIFYAIRTKSKIFASGIQ